MSLAKTSKVVVFAAPPSDFPARNSPSATSAHGLAAAPNNLRNVSAPPEIVSPAPLHNQPANGANNNGLVISDLTTLPKRGNQFLLGLQTQLDQHNGHSE